jgi:YbbR domain-containing protein
MLLALVIAIFLWGVAQGSTDVRYSFDIPVEIHGVDESLVVTEQSAVEVNVGVQGSRAALRNLDGSRIKYKIDVSNVKPGVGEFEVDLASIELPRRARFVSHSPSRIQVRLENRGRKEVSVKADIQGQPAEGFALTEVRVVPDRVWLAGARSHVMRVADVQTEPIDVSGLRASNEVQARLVLGGATTVWAEDGKPVTVQIVVEPIQPPEPESLEIPGRVAPVPSEKEARLRRSLGGRIDG